MWRALLLSLNLEKCLKMIPDNVSRYHIIHHLADVYCELGLPWQAEELSLAKVQQLRAYGKQHSRVFRRVALPLSEAYILQGKLIEAETLLWELVDLFERMSRPDVSDQLGHVRSMFGVARIRWDNRWLETRPILETALSLCEKYKTFSTGNFYMRVIYLFLAVGGFNVDHQSVGQRSLYFAIDELRQTARQHFMPGIGTYFLSHLLRYAESLVEGVCSLGLQFYQYVDLLIPLSE